MQFSEATKNTKVEQPDLVIKKYRISEGNRLNAADGARHLLSC
jgi:hypothetical protein